MKIGTRPLACSLGLLITLVLAPPPGRAATLAFTGTLSRAWYGGDGPLGPVATIPGSGTATITDDGSYHLLSLSIPGSVFGPATLSLPITAQGAIQSVRFTSVVNLFGSFTGLSGGSPAGGPMGLSGTRRLCQVFPSCAAAEDQPPLTPTASTGFGVGGTFTHGQYGASHPTGAHFETLQHNPWTIGQPILTIHLPDTTVITPPLPGGFAHGPASATSSTAQPGGALQLVTATKAHTLYFGLGTDNENQFGELPIVGVLNLHFVPEPGTLVLLGPAALALAAARRGSDPRRSRGRGTSAGR